MKLKETVKSFVGALCESPWFRGKVRRSAQKCVNVVYYHYVGAPKPHYSAFYSGCTVFKLERDLEHLSRVFDFAPLSEVLASNLTQVDADRPTLAVTFDDGFDLRENGVMEVLDRFGVRATTFVITSCVGNRAMMWRHMLSAVQTWVTEAIWVPRYNQMALSFGLTPIQKRPDLMGAASTWDMQRKDEWAALLWARCGLPPIEDYLGKTRPYFEYAGLNQWLAAGHSVGFHTHTHPYCSRLRQRDLESELIEPAVQLKQRLGIAELSLSYPFGDRLQPALEQQLFEKGIFQAFFGIRGCRRRGVSNAALERAGVEGGRVGWAVFARHLFGVLGAN